MKNIFFVFFIGAVLLFTSCNGEKVTTNSQQPVSSETPLTVQQTTIDALVKLPAGYSGEGKRPYSPSEDSARQEGWFDANLYFTVLNRLSMEPGYTLDYVYVANGSGAYPYLYARKTSAEPFNSMQELFASYDADTPWDKNDHSHDFLNHVQADGTEDSFFQYVALYVMGGQFYLWWHAAYNDTTIVCEKAALDRIFAESLMDISVPDDVKKSAYKLNLMPEITINDTTARVRLITFTKWGGFEEAVFTISRAAPHSIIDITTTVLVKYHVNITF